MYNLFETLHISKLKHKLNQKQANVKFPQMPLITIGEISLPNNLESQGLLCIGAKKDRLNTSINLVHQLKERTDFRGIILDYNGELLKRFYDPDLDLIFNPLDERSVVWTHKAEEVSGHQLASFLINVAPASDTFFCQLAILILARIFDSSATNDEVWQKLNVLIPQELVNYLPDNDIAASLLHEPGIARTIISIIKNATQFYRYLEDKSQFSFHGWINNDDPGWIFIPWYDENEEDMHLTPLRQLVMNLVLQGLLEQKGMYHHKSAVIIPDLPCDMKLNKLSPFVVEGCQGLSRKFLFLGSENISALCEEYGQQNAQVFLEGMPTKLLTNGWAKGLNQEHEQILVANDTPLSALQRNLPPGQGYLAINDRCVKIRI